MASVRQINANRDNGTKGGPKTPEGRAAVRFNALRHGLAAAAAVLPGEDAQAFEDMRALLKHDLAPATTHEHNLADQIIVAWWRVLRLRGVETAMLTQHIEIRQRLAREAGRPQPDPDHAIAEAFTGEPCDTFRSYFRYDALIERSYYRALRQLERVQALRRKLSESGIRSVLQPTATPQYPVPPDTTPQDCGQHVLYIDRKSV